MYKIKPKNPINWDQKKPKELTEEEQIEFWIEYCKIINKTKTPTREQILYNKDAFMKKVTISSIRQAKKKSGRKDKLIKKKNWKTAIKSRKPQRQCGEWSWSSTGAD